MRSRQARTRRFCLKALYLVVVIGATIPAAADPRSDYLIRLLKGSSQFRVRAQAAISLSNIKENRDVVAALAAALRDDHPAVRAASASSLERLGDPSALSALEAARSDREKAVRAAVQKAIAALQKTVDRRRGVAAPAPGVRPPTGPPRYYVGVGMPGSTANFVDKKTLEQVRAFIESRVREVEGVLIAPENENPVKVRTVLESKKLKGYYLDSSIVSVEAQPGGGMRAVVSVIVGTYPGRDMKMILQGAATVIGAGSTSKTQAIEGAFRGALRRLPQALAVSGG